MKIPCKRKIRILEPRNDNVLFSGLLTRSETNRDVRPQNMVLGVRFWINAEDRLKDLCGENKGTDQLRGDRTADRNIFFAYSKTGFSHNTAHTRVSNMYKATSTNDSNED